MANATIVTLGSGSQVSSVSFENAFGEYSEARGGGRAKREAKRKERKAARQERIAERNIRKSTRQEARKTRKEARIEHRATAQEMRQQKRTAKAQHRQERKGLRDEAADMDETTALETGVDTGAEQGYSPDAGLPQDSGSNEQGGGYTEEQGGGSTEEQGGSTEDGGDGGYAEDGGEEESGDGSDDSVDDSGFDGELLGENSDLTGVVKVPKEISDLANKIEWNKELVSRLRVKGAEARGKNQDSADIQNQINIRTNRIAELQKAMKNYVSMDGTSDADGGNSGMNKRFKQTKIATQNARKERIKKMSPEALQSTKVARKLNPQFGTNRIVVPAEENGSSFNGTGLVGLDESNDFDAPQTRIIEMQSGFDGMKNINWMSVAIGVGIGVAGIWAIRKYKLV